MRTSILTVLAFVFGLGLLGAPALAYHGVPAAYAVTAVDGQTSQPAAPAPGRIDVDINTHGAWYTNPVWIAIGVLALVVIIALIVMAGRGGTTVVKG